MKHGDPNVPHSPEAERSVLGAIMIDNALMPSAVAILVEADFHGDRNRRIFRAMVSLAERSTAIDTITIMEALNSSGDLESCGGPAYIASLVDGVPRSSSIRYYANIVKEKSRDRAVAHASQRLIDSLMGRNGAGPGEGREEIVAAATAAQQLITDLHADHDAARTHLKDLDVLAMIRDGVPQPVFDLEDLLVRRTLTYLTGAPKGFKTWLALGWAIVLATGRSFAGLSAQGDHRVLFIEAESSLQIPERFAKLCLGLQVNPEAVLERLHFMVPVGGLRLDDPAQAAHLLNTAKDLGATWVVIDSFVRVHALDENSSADMARLANLALLPLRDEGGAGVLMLDHPPKPWAGMARGRKEQVRGSWEKLAAADGQIHVDAHQTDTGKVAEITVAASRVAPEREVPLFVRLASTKNGGLCFEVAEAPAAPPKVGRPGKVEQAINIIRAERGRNPDLKCSDAVACCKREGISERTAKTAWSEVKDECKVQEVQK